MSGQPEAKPTTTPGDQSGEENLLQHAQDIAREAAASHGNHLLAGVSAEDIFALLQQSERRRYARKESILRPGENNDFLHLLLSGRLRVYLGDVEAKNTTTFVVEPGESIGEMSFIENRRTSAHVIVEEEADILQVPSAVFWEKFVHFPGTARSLLRLLVGRMRNINHVIVDSMRERLQLQNLQKELAHAARIQEGLMPDGSSLLPKHPQVDVCALIQPARGVGGDFYDVFALDERFLFLCVGDVSGKGMPAALFMIRLITLLRSSFARSWDLKEVVTDLNEHLCRDNEENMFATLFAGIFDVETGHLRVLNGGHNPPFLAEKDDVFHPLWLPRGLLLGIVPETEYEETDLILQPGDTLFLYTDGITESIGSKGELFGMERTQKVLAPLNSRTNEAAEILAAVREAVQNHAHGVPQSDDITMLALRYLGQAHTVSP